MGTSGRQLAVPVGTPQGQPGGGRPSPLPPPFFLSSNIYLMGPDLRPPGQASMGQDKRALPPRSRRLSATVLTVQCVAEVARREAGGPIADTSLSPVHGACLP